MIKSASLLISGIVLGAGTMYFFVRVNVADYDGWASNSILQGAERGIVRRQATDVLSASDSLAVYRTANAESSISNLRSSLETAAAKPWSPARNVEIDALIARMSELSPAQAAIATRTLGLESQFVAEAFVNWAEADPDAALAELARVENPVDKREVSLALLDVFGDNGSGFDRITNNMTQIERESLRVEWLGHRAQYDPAGAFRDAQGLFDSELQRRALLKVGATWVEQDPISALSQSDFLSDPLRSSYRSNVFSEWARLDGAGFLVWLQSAGTPPEEAFVGIRYLTITDPERMLGMLDGMPGTLGRQIQIAALQGLAEIDPEAAMARVSALPPGSDRDSMLVATGMSLARSDPDAALAWARNLSPPSPNALQQIVMAIAQSNPERAFEFIDNPPEGVDPNLISSMMVSVVSRDPAQAEILANKLIARNSIQDRNALRNLIGNWMQQDPERALEWILVHDEQVNAGVLGNAAQAMARTDAVAAANYASRIPDEYRSAWITQVAGPYALNDPAAALAWVGQYQGQDFYDAALSSVIAGSAQVDPRRAADLLSQASAAVQLASARQVAQIWANQEPRAAAQWVAAMTDERMRESAAGPVVSVWANNDPGAALNWTLDLDRGATRDQALNSVISRQAADGDFNPDLLSAFSSDTARQDALRRVIPGLSRTDPDTARELLGQVTNAATRRQIEEQIERANILR